MDHPDEKIANKDEEPVPLHGPDVVVPDAKTDSDSSTSPAAETDGGESTREDTEEEVLSSEEPLAVPTSEDKSPRSSSDSPARDQETSPSDPEEQTPTVTVEAISSESSGDHPPEPAEAATSEPSPADSPDTSSASTHSVPESAAGLDSPMPPNSTAPSSARTSLTDIPGAASSSSLLSSKPVGILRSVTLPRTTSTQSMTAVSFAPLPPVEPRRRASHLQLGVAARSRMLRARRMRFIDPETGEAYVQVVDGGAAAHAPYAYPGAEAAADSDPYRIARPRPPRYSGFWTATQGMTTPEEDALRDATRGAAPEEDALVALGKMVRGGAKLLWRKVSKSQRGRAAGAAEAGADEGENEGEGEGEGESEGEGGADEGGEAGSETDGAQPKRRPSMRRRSSAPAELNAGRDEEREGEESALRIEFQEPRHCFEESTPAPPPLVPQSILQPSAAQELPAEKLVQVSRNTEIGRVWEEAVDMDTTKRFEAVARAEREKERGKGRLVAKLTARTSMKIGKRKESKRS